MSPMFILRLFCPQVIICGATAAVYDNCLTGSAADAKLAQPARVHSVDPAGRTKLLLPSSPPAQLVAGKFSQQP